MALDLPAPPEREGRPPLRTWAYLIAGLVLIAVGAFLPGRQDGTLQGPRAFLLGGGLITVGAAVARRLRMAPQDIDARVVTAGMLLAAGFGVWLAYVGTPDRIVPETAFEGGHPEREWDSARMVLALLGIADAAGIILVLLPMAARKVAVSLLVLLHFSSIFVSVVSVPPPNSPAPWLAVQAWTYFFRPYSSIMYLNNAYHFYSPEPGPATLAWFYVRYSDDSGRWIKLPSRKDSPVPLHFQRLLALTESINVINHSTPPNYNELASARRLAGKLFDPEIPLPFEAAPTVAYQPPEEYSRIMIAAYSRYVARNWPHPDDNPEATVKTVKAYRLVHQIINAPTMVQGASPDDPTWDLAYFMGEFNPQGDMLDPTDPFLYFWLPIRREMVTGGPDEQPKEELRNYLEEHARGRTSLKEAKP
jgi:uncharacterized membrane protein YphA (DoxX/SURF4 family)